MSQTAAFGETKYNNIRTIKTVVRDVHGVENVIFADTDGKPLASARSGGTIVRTMSLPISEQGYADVHVPEGVSMGFSVNSSDVTIYDLITEDTTTASPSMPKGFYRVAVNNPEAYVPGSIIITYKENYYDYSLNEYNITGQLTATYQPVGSTKASKPVTTFKYNTLGQLTETTSPDEGIAQFKYRKDGQIRFSQNSKQLAAGEFSYTNYDTFGRPLESGVLESSAFTTANPDLVALPAGTRKEQIFTVYDVPDNSALATELGSLAANYTQNFSAGNVTKTHTAGNATATWYGYDIYGRVAWVVQKIAGLGIKTIDYEYDPVTGSVTKVYYQKYTPADRFIHRYTYNLINQLIKVETSTDDAAFTNQAEYRYYENGSLRRVQLAPVSGVPLQGIDYVYNLSGQLKSINHPSLQQADDPGGDANDVFGMAIDYNSADYSRNLPNIASPAYGTDQLNGNIKGIRWNGSQSLSTNQNTYAYSYNRDNWLTQALYGTYSNTSGFVPNAAADYKVNNLTYDANGNIQSLSRNKHTENGSNQMDQLTYRYTTGKPNRLLRVEDAVTAGTNADDIKTQTGTNYVYNAIGQLTRDEAEHLTYTYNASGLVTRVAKDCGGAMPCYSSSVSFVYNER
ncbi:MAG: hypothetical protein Q8J76_11575, partial [Desulfobulbaceae bacterium]|nr:hypothetical protein [Desulfobulbaceae bacterium]